MRFCPSDMGHVRRAHAGLSHARRLPLVGGGAEPGQRSRGHLEGLDEANSKSYERAALCYDVAHGLHKEEAARRAERGEALRGARLSSPRPRGAEKRRSRRGQRRPTLRPNMSGAISGVGCRAWPKTRCRMTGCVSWVRRRTPRTATAYSRCEVARWQKREEG